MKITKLAGLLAAVLTVASSDAATTSYQFTTGTTAASNGIINGVSGKAFQNSVSATYAGPGTVGVGYFNITDAAILAATSPATLISAFQNWNTNGTSTFNAPGAVGNRGVFNISPAAARDLQTGGSGAGFQDKAMYVFVGNGATYAASTQFLVLKSTYTFNPAESGVTTYAKTFTTANSAALIGSSVADVKTTNTDATVTPGWSTAALIPETSTALLGALGALGLLRRRR